MVETDENLVTKVSRTFVYETDDDAPDLYYNADRIEMTFSDQAGNTSDPRSTVVFTEGGGMRLK